MSGDPRNQLSPEAREAMEASCGRWLRAMGSGLRVDDQQPVQPAKTRQGGAEGTQSASSDPLSLRSLRVGDEVVVCVPGSEPKPAIITAMDDCTLKAGRYTYSLSDGVAHTRKFYKPHAITPAKHAQDQRVDEARRALFNLSEDRRSMPAARLLAIHDTLKAAGLL